MTERRRFKSYIKDSRKLYIEQNTIGFAKELCLIDKHKVKEDINTKQQLFEYLNIGFILSDKEETLLISKALEIKKRNESDG